MKFDFFSKSEARLNEVVFQGRNQSYGAYVLRNEEGLMIRKALYAGLGFVLTVFTIPFVVSSISNKNVAKKDDVTLFNLKDVANRSQITKDFKKVETMQQQKTNKTVSQEYKPVKDFINQPNIVKPSVTDISGNTGVGNDGLVSGNHQSSERSTHSGNGEMVISKPIITKPVVDEPYSKVDVEADFEGGINKFRTSIVNGFDVTDFEDSGEVLKAVVTFVVEKDGTLSQLKVTGVNPEFNREAENAIKSVKGKWIPAKLDGKVVRSYFKFPISMDFD